MSGDGRTPSVERTTPARRRAAVTGPLVIAGWLALAGPGLAQEPAPAAPPDTEESTGRPDYAATPGVRLGHTGLTVGAFTTLEIDKEQDGEAEVALDSVNPLALWEPLGFFKAFGELEVGPLVSWQPSSGRVESEPEIRIERLHVDLSGGDAVNLRLGKFQTPVGIWNLVPAEPFTWTATSPVLVESAFDEHQTGGALFGSFYPGRTTLEYWLYGQFVDALDVEEDEEPAERSIGGRLRVTGARNEWALGGSFLASTREGEWQTLVGLDFSWSRGALEVQGEMAAVRGDVPGRELWGGYVQAVYDVGRHERALQGLHAVARYELFDRAGPQRSHIGNLGLTWIPRRWLSLKVGYQLVDGTSDDVRPGTFSSVSLIF